MDSFTFAFPSPILCIVFGILWHANEEQLVMGKAVLWRTTHGCCIVARCILFIVVWAIHKSEREKCEPLGSEFCEEKQSDNFHLENCLGQLQEGKNEI